jgi:hypothetical protein
VPELDLKEDRKQQVEQLGDSVEEQEEEGGLDRKRHSIYIRTVRPCPNVSATEDGSTDAVPQILYGQYLILGGFGSCMF